MSAIAAAPGDPEPYAVPAEPWRDAPQGLAALTRGDSLPEVLALSYLSFLRGDMDDAAPAIGSVVGARADIAWASAPWFHALEPAQSVFTDRSLAAYPAFMDPAPVQPADSSPFGQVSGNAGRVSPFRRLQCEAKGSF